MATHVDIENFINSLEKDYQPRAWEACRHAVEKFCEFIISEAQQLCPKKTTTLASSDFVEDAVREVNNIFCEFGFNTDYAAAVHEILTNKHPNGQAKFLETPMREHAPRLRQYVLEELQKEFG